MMRGTQNSHPEDEEIQGGEEWLGTDDEELSQYNEAEKPGFNRMLLVYLRRPSNGGSVMGSNAQAEMLWW